MPIRTSIKKQDSKQLLGNAMLAPNNIYIIGSEAIFAKDAPHTQGTGDSAFWMYNMAADAAHIAQEGRPTNEHDWHMLLRNKAIDRSFFINNVLGEKYDFEPLAKFIDPDLKDFVENAISYNLIETFFTTAVDRCLEVVLNDICSKQGKELVVYNFKIANDLDEYNRRNPDKEISLVYLFGAMDYDEGWGKNEEFVYSEDDAMKTITDYLRIPADNKKTSYENIFYRNSIMAIGCRFEDWKFRFFWYSIRGDISRLADGTVAYSCEDEENDPLYNYLKRKNGLHLVNDSRKFLREMAGIMEGAQFLNQMLEKRKQGDIFISYASEDVKIAMQLFEELKARHFNVWIDYYGLQPMDTYTLEIEKAIKSCDIFIPILSSQMKHDIENKNERFYMKEWDMAQASGRKIAPITVGDYSCRENYHSVFRNRAGLDGKKDITLCSFRELEQFLSIIEKLRNPKKD